MNSVIVVGASLAGVSTARALRREGFGGSITVIGDEPHLPYDRPPLSKEFLLGQSAEDDLSLLLPDEDLQVDWMLNSRAIALDPASRTVTLDDGRQVSADAIVAATGARARTLPELPALDGVHLLRSLDDARRLRAALTSGRRLAIIGAGFIGSEIASAAVSLGVEVTILEAQSQPLVRALGTEAAQVISAFHARHGVRLRCDVEVVSLVGEESVSGVLVAPDEVVPADAVVIGVGSLPNVEWLDGSGLATQGGLHCDTHGHTGLDGVYGVGDCSAWFDADLGRHHRIEHWTDSRDRPLRVARHLLGRPDTSPLAPPYFWSDQYGVRLQFAGRLRGDEEFVVDSGGPETDDLLAFYLRDGEQVAVLGINRLREVSRWRRLHAASNARKGTAHA